MVNLITTSLAVNLYIHTNIYMYKFTAMYIYKLTKHTYIKNVVIVYPCGIVLDAFAERGISES